MRRISALAVLVFGLCLSLLASPPGGAATPRTPPGLNVPILRASEQHSPPLSGATSILRTDLALPAAVAPMPRPETATATAYGLPALPSRYDAPARPAIPPPRE